jgi:hypothetical protein
MGLSHCPLCQGLAVLCLVRYGAYALLLWNLVSGAKDPAAATPSTATAIPFAPPEGPPQTLLPALPAC